VGFAVSAAVASPSLVVSASAVSAVVASAVVAEELDEEEEEEEEEEANSRTVLVMTEDVGEMELTGLNSLLLDWHNIHIPRSDKLAEPQIEQIQSPRVR
jgi:hypothetical protein